MAVSFVAVGTSAEANNAGITPGLPTRQAGDLLVAVVGLRSNTATVSVSSGSGWTSRISYASQWSSGANSIHIFTRQASGDSGDAVTFAPSSGASGVDIIGCIFAVRDADLSDPISAYSGAYGTSTQEDIGPTASLTVPDIGSLAVVVGSKANDSSSSPGTEIATPSGWGYIFVEDSVAGDDLLVGAFYLVTSGAGQTVDDGTLDVRPTSGPDSWAALTFTIAPPASGVEGQSAATLAAATVDATGRAGVSASGTPHLSRASVSAGAKVQTHGSLAQTLSAGLCVADATLPVDGSGSCRLTATGPAATGRVGVASHLSAALGPGKAQAAAQVVMSGSVAAVLQPATVEAGAGDGITGLGGGTLRAAPAAATGAVAVSGHVAGGLADAQAHSAAEATIRGAGAVGLAEATADGCGKARIGAQIAATLVPATVGSSTSGHSQGHLAAALLPDDLQASGRTVVRGGVAERLAAATDSGAGRVAVAAALAVGLGAAAGSRAGGRGRGERHHRLRVKNILTQGGKT